MTTDADLRAYLDAHGIDGAPTADGLHVVSFVGGGTAVVESRGRYLLGFGVQFLRGDIRRHAPLRLAAPDLPCGHPSACVRPTEGHAGTTRWCGWCEAEAGREHNAGRVIAEQDARERAERDRDAARAEVARLAALLDDTCDRYNAALDRVMSERDALRAQVSVMKVATLDALETHARAALECEPPNVGDLIDDVCEAVGIDRQAPYRARDPHALPRGMRRRAVARVRQSRVRSHIATRRSILVATRVDQSRRRTCGPRVRSVSAPDT